jgi:hypothetical protein
MLEPVFGARLGAYRARRDCGKERKVYGHSELPLYDGRQLHNPTPTLI